MIPQKLVDKISSDLSSSSARLLQATDPQDHVNLAAQLELILLDYVRLVRRYEVPELVRRQIGESHNHDDIPSIYYG